MDKQTIEEWKYSENVTLQKVNKQVGNVNSKKLIIYVLLGLLIVLIGKIINVDFVQYMGCVFFMLAILDNSFYLKLMIEYDEIDEE